MGNDTLVVSEDALMRADIAPAGQLFGGDTGLVYRLGAEFIHDSGAYTRGAHVR